MIDFTPSPVLLGKELVGAATDLVSGGNSDAKKAFLEKYPDIKPYLAIVARSAADQKIDPYFQAAVLAQENGGFTKWSTGAVSPAGAQGIAQFMPGTWSGQWNPYRNKSPNDPSYAIPAQSVYLKNLLKTYGGDKAKAAGAYNGGTPQNAAAGYVSGVRRYENEISGAKIFAGGGGSWVKDAAGAIVHTAEGVVEGAVGQIGAPVKLAEMILNPSKAGELFAQISAVTLKFIGKAVWDYVLAPPFHWCQKATVYYFDEVMGSQTGSNKGFYYTIAAPVTVAFWAVGYGILWRNADDLSMRAGKPEDTPLGKLVGSATSVIAKRNVAAPDKVKSVTPDKPAPTKSTVTVTNTRSLSATRRRQVAVGPSGVSSNSTKAQGRNGRGNSDNETGAEASNSPEQAGTEEAAAAEAVIPA